MVNLRAWLAEFIATFGLAFFGIASVVLSVGVYALGLTIESILFIALAHGGIVAVMVYAFGHISGAHINPAVTIPMLIARKISVKDAIGYIGAQLAGATFGAAAIAAILPDFAKDVGYGIHGGPSDLINKSVLAGIAVEIILTFFLVLTIFMVVVHKKATPGWAGFAIGAAVLAVHLIGVPLTGASVNPARSFGPALISGLWEYQWMYWLAPITGGVLGGLVGYFLFTREK